MSKIAYDLTKIKAIAFDVDGVLSPSCIPLGADGMPQRMVNIKDGYALQLAVKCGLKLAIITGADTESIKIRYQALGIKDIYLKAGNKIVELTKGPPVAPKDAATDIKDIATYISPVEGGMGVARDLLEEVLKAQGLWMHHAKAFGW